MTFTLNPSRRKVLADAAAAATLAPARTARMRASMTFRSTTAGRFTGLRLKVACWPPPSRSDRWYSHQVTQPSGRSPFMYHCHIFEHEDAGTMGRFTTV